MTRLRDGASDFGWKPAEVVPLLRAEGDRVIAVVVNPVAGPDLMILAVSRRNVVSFWLWEELPNRRSRGHIVAKCDWFQIGQSVPASGRRMLHRGAKAISVVLEKMQATEANVLVACCSPQNSGTVPHSLANASQRRTRRQNLSPLESLCPCRAAESFTVDGLREKLREFSQGGTRRRAGCGGTHVYPRQAVCERSSAVCFFDFAVKYA